MTPWKRPPIWLCLAICAACCIGTAPDVACGSGIACAQAPSAPTTPASIRVQFITPAGNPVTSTTNSGEGQNEFTFSDDRTGTLRMEIVVGVTGVQDLSRELSSFRLEVDDIKGSEMKWGTENRSGTPQLKNGRLTATVTFNGLPALNTSFGAKTIRLFYKNLQQASQAFEVFYPAVAKNHPGGGGTPNWFYYYKQAAGGDDYVYDSSISTSHSTPATPGSIHIADNAYFGGRHTETRLVQGRRRATGGSNVYKYFSYFSGVLAHERFHVTNVTAKGGRDDADADRLSDEFETDTSQSDPFDAYSIDGGIYESRRTLDDETWADSEVEKGGILRADLTRDWANPGSNAKP